MVKDIQRGCMKFKCDSFAEFYILEDGYVPDVGDCILLHISGNVAEWRPENSLRSSAIDYVANIIWRGGNWGATAIERVHGEQRSCSLIAEQAKSGACITSEDPNL